MTPTSAPLTHPQRHIWVLLGLLVSDCELSRLKLSVNSLSSHLHAYYLEKLGICEVLTSVEEASRISYLPCLGKSQHFVACWMKYIWVGIPKSFELRVAQPCLHRWKKRTSWVRALNKSHFVVFLEMIYSNMRL